MPQKPVKGKLPTKITMEPTQKKKPKPEPINPQDIKRPVKESNQHRLNIILETVEYIIESRAKKVRERKEELVRSTKNAVVDLENRIRTRGDVTGGGLYRKPSEIIAGLKLAAELTQKGSPTRKRRASQLRTLRSTGRRGEAQGQLDSDAGQYNVSRDERTGLRIKK